MSKQLIEITHLYDGSSDLYEFFERFILTSTELGWDDIKKANNLPVWVETSRDTVQSIAKFEQQ